MWKPGAWRREEKNCTAAYQHCLLSSERRSIVFMKIACVVCHAEMKDNLAMGFSQARESAVISHEAVFFKQSTSHFLLWTDLPTQNELHHSCVSRLRNVLSKRCFTIDNLRDEHYWFIIMNYKSLSCILHYDLITMESKVIIFRVVATKQAKQANAGGPRLRGAPWEPLIILIIKENAQNPQNPL